MAYRNAQDACMSTARSRVDTGCNALEQYPAVHTLKGS